MIPLLTLTSLLYLPSIEQLEDPHFAVRERVEQALNQQVWLAYPALCLRHPRASWELRRRRQRLLEMYHRAWATWTLRTHYPARLPWLGDTGAGPNAGGYVGRATASLLFVVPLGEPDWPEYREATRLWALDALTHGLSPVELRRLLRYWTVCEQDYKRLEKR